LLSLVTQTRVAQAYLKSCDGAGAIEVSMGRTLSAFTETTPS
jgi:hypothetical protein